MVFGWVGYVVKIPYNVVTYPFKSSTPPQQKESEPLNPVAGPLFVPPSFLPQWGSFHRWTVDTNFLVFNAYQRKCIENNLKQQLYNELKEDLMQNIEKALADKNMQKLKEQVNKLRRESVGAEKAKQILNLTRQLRSYRLEDLTILERLGGGSLGIVFLVEADFPQRPKRKFALKMIRNYGQYQTKELLRTYKDEFDLLFQIGDFHPNIIQIYSDFSGKPTQQIITIVEEYGENTDVWRGLTTQFFLAEYHPNTLKTLVEDSRGEGEINVGKIYKWSRQLMDASVFLFRHHVAHRDLKLENILVSFDGDLILNDFGESVNTDSDHCCESGKLAGKGGNRVHQAPEVLNASGLPKVNFSGQYSWEVAFVICEMITGELPFPGYPHEENGYGNAPYITVGPFDPDRFANIFDRFDSDFVSLLVEMLKNDAKQRKGIVEALEAFDKMMLI